MLRLVGVDQRRQNIEPIALRSLALRTPKALDFRERIFVVRFGANRLYLSDDVSPPAHQYDHSLCVSRST